MNSPIFHQWLPNEIIESADCDVPEKWMRYALVEAMRAVGRARPNPTVGAVLVKNGKIISTGATEVWGGRHAEIVCFDGVKNKQEIKGSSLYVTLSPCSHFGKTPPCVDRIVESGVSKVFVGVRDPNPLVNEKSASRLRSAGIEVVEGILESFCQDWHREFFTWITENRPFVALKWAQTLDGKMVDGHGHSQWITGSQTRKYGHLLRQRYDSILVGAKTFLKDSPRLDVRDLFGLDEIRHPHVLIVDPYGLVDRENVSVASRLKEMTAKRFVFVLQPHKQDESLSRVEGISNCYILNSRNMDDCFSWLINQDKLRVMSQLLPKPLSSVYIEGGPRLIQYCLQSGLGDFAHIMISTKVFGKNGRSYSEGFDAMAQDATSQLARVTRTFITEDQDVVIEGFFRPR